MSGATDRTDGTQAAETVAEETGSTEKLSPEAEARAAWEEFTGNKPEDEEDGNADTGDTARSAAESGQDTSDADGDPPPEPAEEEDTSEAGEGEGESSSSATIGAA